MAGETTQKPPINAENVRRYHPTLRPTDIVDATKDANLVNGKLLCRKVEQLKFKLSIMVMKLSCRNVWLIPKKKKEKGKKNSELGREKRNKERFL